MVIGRQRRIIEKAKRTNEIIASCFPKEIRERMLSQAAVKDRTYMIEDGHAEGLWDDMSQEEFRKAVQVDSEEDDKVIADYFPSATIIFQDLVGFTAWSCKFIPMSKSTETSLFFLVLITFLIVRRDSNTGPSTGFQIAGNRFSCVRRDCKEEKGLQGQYLG